MNQTEESSATISPNIANTSINHQQPESQYNFENIEDYISQLKDKQPTFNQMIEIQYSEYRTLMDGKSESKNIPKIFGNYFYKFCRMTELKDLKTPLPQGVIDFMRRKPLFKQSIFGLEDFRNLCSSSKEAKQLFYHYITNCLYLDLLHSDKIQNPLKYLNFIEQYAAGALEPEKFITNIKFSQISKKKIHKRQN